MPAFGVYLGAVFVVLSPPVGRLHARRLNHQIEHHLFPAMPRANLRRAQPLVREFCDGRGIDYAQCGLLKTCYYVLRHLHDAGAPLRERSAPAR